MNKLRDKRCLIDYSTYGHYRESVMTNIYTKISDNTLSYRVVFNLRDKDKKTKNFMCGTFASLQTATYVRDLCSYLIEYSYDGLLMNKRGRMYDVFFYQKMALRRRCKNIEELYRKICSESNLQKRTRMNSKSVRMYEIS